MSLNNTNTQIFQLQNYGYKPETIDKYECDQDLLDEYNVSTVGTYMVKWSDFDLDGREGQVRATDIDPSHLNTMKISIEKNGITHWPLGTYNNKTGKIALLSGHHRVTALLETSLDSENPIFPIMLVKHQTKLSKRQWMQKENLHLTSVAKASTKADAKKYIQEMKDDFGLFKKLDKKATKQKVYDILSDYFPFVRGKAKKDVYEEVILGNAKTSVVKTITKTEQNNLEISVWGTVCGPGKTIGDRCFIASLYDPSRKSIMMQCVDRSIAHEANPDTCVMDINLIVWFPAKIGNLPQARQQALECYKKMNSHVIDSGMALISEVVFPEQDTSKNLKNNYNYSWDSVLKEFV